MTSLYNRKEPEGVGVHHPMVSSAGRRTKLSFISSFPAWTLPDKSQRRLGANDNRDGCQGLGTSVHVGNAGSNQSWCWEHDFQSPLLLPKTDHTWRTTSPASRLPSAAGRIWPVPLSPWGLLPASPRRVPHGRASSTCLSYSPTPSWWGKLCTPTLHPWA